MNTGKIDKNGIEMAVGDVVHFKAGNISGRGIVYQIKEPADYQKVTISESKTSERVRILREHIRITRTQHIGLT